MYIKTSLRNYLSTNRVGLDKTHKHPTPYGSTLLIFSRCYGFYLDLSSNPHALLSGAFGRVLDHGSVVLA